jgi:hypothetical protein
VCLLLAGDFAQGLPLYEWRKRLEHAMVPPLAAPIWHGAEDLAGRTLLIYADQALGDTLQFCRYAHLAQQRGAQMIVRVQPQLTELLASLGPDIRVIAPGEEPRGCDYQCALLSLPLAFATTLQTIPAAVPYLAADPRRVAHWREQLGAGGFRVGIVWQGSRHRIDVGRSVPLEMFRPLATVPGVRLISLQKGAALEQLRAAQAGFAVETPGEPFDQGPQAFLDSAALMSALDLVITCDTATCASRRGAWVFDRVGRASSTCRTGAGCSIARTARGTRAMRLFRQPRHGDWEAVFATIHAQLARLASGGGGNA